MTRTSEFDKMTAYMKENCSPHDMLTTGTTFSKTDI